MKDLRSLVLPILSPVTLYQAAFLLCLHHLLAAPAALIPTSLLLRTLSHYPHLPDATHPLGAMLNPPPLGGLPCYSRPH